MPDAVSGVKIFAPGAEVEIASDVTVYAQWRTATAPTATITFAPGQHGSGSMESIVVNTGDEFVLPSNEFTPDDGYRFLYWNLGYG